MDINSFHSFPLFITFAFLSTDCIPWSGESTDWFTQTIKSEHFFTGFIHKPNKDDWRLPIDLYACTDDLNMDVTSPPAIDTNIGYMMLLVDMASPFAVVKSHLEGHYGEISLLSCKLDFLVIHAFMLCLLKAVCPLDE